MRRSQNGDVFTLLSGAEFVDGGIISVRDMRGRDLGIALPLPPLWDGMAG